MPFLVTKREIVKILWWFFYLLIVILTLSVKFSVSKKCLSFIFIFKFLTTYQRNQQKCWRLLYRHQLFHYLEQEQFHLTEAAYLKIKALEFSIMFCCLLHFLHQDWNKMFSSPFLEVWHSNSFVYYNFFYPVVPLFSNIFQPRSCHNCFTGSLVI